MTEVLKMVAVVSLVSAFIILLLKKWGVAEWMQVHGDDITSRLFACDLCMSFWTSVVLTVFAVTLMHDPVFFCVPILSTPITRILV